MFFLQELRRWPKEGRVRQGMLVWPGIAVVGSMYVGQVHRCRLKWKEIDGNL